MLQMFDLLTGLPSSLTCALFRDWLCVKSVMRLNSAYCSKAHRKNFVNTYLYGEYVIHSQGPISGRSMYNRSSLLSLLKRGEKLQSVRLHRAKITSAQLEIVERHCHQLTQVYLDGGIDRWTLLTVNPHIGMLKITLPYTEKSYESIPYTLFPIPVGTVLQVWPDRRSFSACSDQLTNS